MPTEQIYPGRVFEIRGWVENDSCQVLDFLEYLRENGDSDAERLENLMMRIADNGVTHNKLHSNPLSENIYEFKAPKTGRILYFYDKNYLIICSHGFKGKKGNEKKFIKGQIEIAERIRDDYFSENG